jgi:excisionase family DNA binding protein
LRPTAFGGGRVRRGNNVAEREALVAELFGAEPDGDGRFLRTREVAILFQVSERAVTDWARKGRIRSVRTPGGHRRYPSRHVRSLLEASGQGELIDLRDA